MIEPRQLREIVRANLMSFPTTPFDAENNVDAKAFAEHLSWMTDFSNSGFIVAGGTGEFFSLTPQEVVDLVRLAKATSPDSCIISGCGYGTRMACEIAQGVEEAGGDGILLMPHYMIDAPEDGIKNHVRSVCQSTKLGVIVYNRGISRLSADALARLADDCPNLIGFKDGAGDIDNVRRATIKLGNRLVFMGGMPTHELFADAYKGVGIDTYSSAVFNFVPQTALAFYKAYRDDDHETRKTMLKEFYYPLVALRDVKKGYAVSAIKAGVALRGFYSGKMRPPLTALSESECDKLKAIIGDRG